MILQRKSSLASIYPNHPGISRMKADLSHAHAAGTPITLYLATSDCIVTELVLGGW